MMRNFKIKLSLSLFIAVVFGLGLSANANAQAQRAKAAFNREEATPQPLYTQYKGVQLGMSADEARAKLGTPALKESDQDYYMFSENETAQIVYDGAHKVVTISVDYAGGVGAPQASPWSDGEAEMSPRPSMMAARNRAASCFGIREKP